MPWYYIACLAQSVIKRLTIPIAQWLFDGMKNIYKNKFGSFQIKISIGLLLTDVLMYFNFVPFVFFQLQSIDCLWIDRKTLVT